MIEALQSEAMRGTPARMTDDFLTHRELLFGIAYRLLGSVADAEDLVQETYLRWQRQKPENVETPRAWLVTTLTRLGIDELRTARRRRENYVGVWLPEPIVDDFALSPDDSAARADSLSLAFLHVLETLGPVERAVFLLREVFDYDYAEIARIVEKSEASCRQIFSRAKNRLGKVTVNQGTAERANEGVVRRFLAACASGDVGELLSLLADDAVLFTDGGGRVRSALRPIITADRISRFYAGIHDRAFANVEMEFVRVNGAAGFILRRAGDVVAVTTIGMEGGRIRAVYTVSNPDKLRALARSSSGDRVARDNRDASPSLSMTKA